jgi:AAA domain
MGRIRFMVKVVLARRWRRQPEIVMGAWAIIEEAGKAHGFDLALPLQTGHRWVLIGDHKQLPPYRFKGLPRWH